MRSGRGPSPRCETSQHFAMMCGVKLRPTPGNTSRKRRDAAATCPAFRFASRNRRRAPRAAASQECPTRRRSRGNQVLESFTPASRFRSDSAKSPIMPAAPNQQTEGDPSPGRPGHCGRKQPLEHDPRSKARKGQCSEGAFDCLARTNQRRHFVAANQSPDGISAGVAHLDHDNPRGHGMDAPVEAKLHGEHQKPTDIDPGEDRSGDVDQTLARLAIAAHLGDEDGEQREDVENRFKHQEYNCASTL